MRRNNLSTVIQRVYGSRYNLDPYEIAPRPRYYLSAFQAVTGVIQKKRFQIITVLLLALVIGGSIYYYNLLVTTEQDVLAEKGKVQALLQRRNDISINLSKAAFDYSRHEREVFTAVVSLRAILSDKEAGRQQLEEIIHGLDAPGTMSSERAILPDKEAGGQQLEEIIHGLDAPGTMSSEAIKRGVGGGSLSALSSLDRLIAVAEQYPDLKLSANFLNLMTALVEVEKDLATERIKYNDFANVYTTNLAKFPVNFYAWIFGFESEPYFEATDEAKSLKPIKY